LFQARTWNKCPRAAGIAILAARRRDSPARAPAPIYQGQVVLFNGTPEATAIYERWTDKNLESGRVSGARAIDVRTALSDHFRDEFFGRLRCRQIAKNGDTFR
jgi:hypothetical protein